MRLLLLPAFFAAALCAGGCASHQPSYAKLEKQMLQENSRTTEQRRMKAVTTGDAASLRGAEVVVWDPNKTFDPNHSALGGNRTYNATSAQSKSFYFDQKAKPTTYGTRDFAGTKTSSAIDKQFATASANTKAPYATKAATTKTAATKTAVDADKLAATRELWDAKRPYLGQEASKMQNSVDQTKDVGWSGEMKTMTIEDIRDLLNKSK